MFSKRHIKLSLSCSDLPYIGRYIQAPFSEYLEKQKLKLHRKPGDQGNQPVSQSLLINFIADVVIITCYTTTECKLASEGVWVCDTSNGLLLSHLHCQFNGTELCQKN